MAGADFNPNVGNSNIKPTTTNSVGGQAPVSKDVAPKTSQVDTVAISGAGKSSEVSPQAVTRAVAHEVGSFGLSPRASKLLFNESTAA